jgi:hypothetical protein
VQFIAFVCVAAVLCVSSGCSNDAGGPPTASGGSGQATAKDVESLLKNGKWEDRSGLGNGMSWKFVNGGKVLIQTGGEIDESFRWEVLSRDEGERMLRIKYWRPSRGDREHREWKFSFAPDGSSAVVDNFEYRDGRMHDSSESTMYRVQ